MVGTVVGTDVPVILNVTLVNLTVCVAVVVTAIPVTVNVVLVNVPSQ